MPASSYYIIITTTIKKCENGPEVVSVSRQYHMAAPAIGQYHLLSFRSQMQVLTRRCDASVCLSLFVRLSVARNTYTKRGFLEN